MATRISHGVYEQLDRYVEQEMEKELKLCNQPNLDIIKIQTATDAAIWKAIEKYLRRKVNPGSPEYNDLLEYAGFGLLCIRQRGYVAPLRKPLEPSLFQQLGERIMSQQTVVDDSLGTIHPIGLAIN